MRYSEDTKTLNFCQAEIPRVVGFYNPHSERISVTCPLCGQVHTHGPALGPRVSHCEREPQQYVIGAIVRRKQKPRRVRWNYGEI